MSAQYFGQYRVGCGLYDSIVWETLVGLGGAYVDYDCVELCEGIVSIEHDTLVFKFGYVVEQPKSEQELKAVANYMATLPRWDKTKYVLYYEHLLETSTEKEAPPDIIAEMMPKLGFVQPQWERSEPVEGVPF